MLNVRPAYHVPMNRSPSCRPGGVSLGVVIVCIVCVLLGGIVGSIVTQQVMIHQAETLLSDREQYPRLITTRIDAAVPLRPEQREKINGIIKQRLDRVWQMSDLFWPITRAQIDQTAHDIRRVLDEEQRQQFNEDYRAFINRMDEMMHGE